MCNSVSMLSNRNRLKFKKIRIIFLLRSKYLRSTIVLPKYMAPPMIRSARVHCDPFDVKNDGVTIEMSIRYSTSHFSRPVRFTEYSEKIVLDTIYKRIFRNKSRNFQFNTPLIVNNISSNERNLSNLQW